MRGLDWIEWNDPGKFLGIVEPLCAGGQEKVRNAFAVKVFLDRYVGRRSQRAGYRKNLVRLDEPSCLFERFRRTECVIERDQVNVAAVDAAKVVDHLEIGDLRQAVGGGRRCRAAVIGGGAELDFGVTDARPSWNTQSASFMR